MIKCTIYHWTPKTKQTNKIAWFNHKRASKWLSVGYKITHRIKNENNKNTRDFFLFYQITVRCSKWNSIWTNIRSPADGVKHAKQLFNRVNPLTHSVNGTVSRAQYEQIENERTSEGQFELKARAHGLSIWKSLCLCRFGNGVWCMRACINCTHYCHAEWKADVKNFCGKLNALKLLSAYAQDRVMEGERERPRPNERTSVSERAQESQTASPTEQRHQQ